MKIQPAYSAAAGGIFTVIELVGQMIFNEYVHVNDTTFLLSSPMAFFLRKTMPGDYFRALYLLEARYMGKTGCDELEKKIEELEQSKKTLRAILLSTPTGIGVVKSRVMEWHNPAMSHMLGYTSEELHGKNARILYPDEKEFDRVGKAIASLGPSNRTTSIETTWVRKDGSVFDCLIRLALLDPDSGNSATVAIVEDITDRKRAE
ncbi:MAG: hypothetical protein DRG82_15345, partial [Deltaproteobacteria bacterium]